MVTHGQRAEAQVPTTEVLKGWVRACLTEGRNLTGWEAKFLASLDNQLAGGHYLSGRQIEVLERVYAEKTPC